MPTLSATPNSDININKLSYLIAVIDNEDDTFTEVKFSLQQLIGGLRKNISITADGATLTDDFFAETINTIYSKADNVTYITGVDFTQDGTTITATTFLFQIDDTIITSL